MKRTFSLFTALALLLCLTSTASATGRIVVANGRFFVAGGGFAVVQPQIAFAPQVFVQPTVVVPRFRTFAVAPAVVAPVAVFRVGPFGGIRRVR